MRRIIWDSAMKQVSVQRQKAKKLRVGLERLQNKAMRLRRAILRVVMKKG